MNGLLSPAMSGTLRYESMMAMRRRVPWVSLLPLCALALLIALSSPTLTTHTDLVARMGSTAMMVNVLGSVGVAIALADRMAAQRLPGLPELIGATSAGPLGRAAGVVLGPWLVAMAPVFAVLMIVGGWLSVGAGSARPLIAGLVGFVAIVLPGALLLTMFANLLALIFPAAVSRVLVVPLWYWATALSPLIPLPTVTGTILSPLGSYQAAAWLGTRPPPAGADWPHPQASTTTALLAIGITLAATALLFSLCRVVQALRR